MLWLPATSIILFLCVTLVWCVCAIYSNAIFCERCILIVLIFLSWSMCTWRWTNVFVQIEIVEKSFIGTNDKKQQVDILGFLKLEVCWRKMEPTNVNPGREGNPLLPLNYNSSTRSLLVLTLLLTRTVHCTVWWEWTKVFIKMVTKRLTALLDVFRHVLSTPPGQLQTNAF